MHYVIHKYYSVFGQVFLVRAKSISTCYTVVYVLDKYISSSMICDELYRRSQKTTVNNYLDCIVQNGLACGLWGSVWLCPELSRTKYFADATVVQTCKEIFMPTLSTTHS